MVVNNNVLRKAIVAAGCPAPSPDSGVFLVGVRSARRTGPSSIAAIEPIPDQFDDVIIVAGSQWGIFPASVDPGLRFTKNPANPDGTAHIANGGPHWFVKGKHKGKPALVQGAEERLIWRDANRNGIRDLSEKIHPVYWRGLNLHRAEKALKVGFWSQGCQVISTLNGEWDAFWWLMEATAQKRFPYYLLDSKILP